MPVAIDALDLQAVDLVTGPDGEVFGAAAPANVELDDALQPRATAQRRARNLERQTRSGETIDQWVGSTHAASHARGART